MPSNVFQGHDPNPPVPALSLEPIFRRSHFSLATLSSLHKALARGGVDADAMRDLRASHRLGHWPLVSAVDASTWGRCDAETGPERGFYYSASKHSAGSRSDQWDTGLDWASNSWTAPMDARSDLIHRRCRAGHHRPVRDLFGRLGHTATTPVSSSMPGATRPR